MFFIVVVVTTCLAYIRKLLSSPGQPYGNRISTATRSNSSPPNCRAWWGVTTSCVPLPSCCFIHHWPSYLCWRWIFSQWFLAPSYLRWPISCLTFFFYFLSPFMYPLSLISNNFWSFPGIRPKFKSIWMGTHPYKILIPL